MKREEGMQRSISREKNIFKNSCLFFPLPCTFRDSVVYCGTFPLTSLCNYIMGDILFIYGGAGGCVGVVVVVKGSFTK